MGGNDGARGRNVRYSRASKLVGWLPRKSRAGFCRHRYVLPLAFLAHCGLRLSRESLRNTLRGWRCGAHLRRVDSLGRDAGCWDRCGADGSCCRLVRGRVDKVAVLARDQRNPTKINLVIYFWKDQVLQDIIWSLACLPDLLSRRLEGIECMRQEAGEHGAHLRDTFHNLRKVRGIGASQSARDLMVTRVGCQQNVFLARSPLAVLREQFKCCKESFCHSVLCIPSPNELNVLRPRIKQRELVCEVVGLDSFVSVWSMIAETDQRILGLEDCIRLVSCVEIGQSRVDTILVQAGPIRFHVRGGVNHQHNLPVDQGGLIRHGCYLAGAGRL
mmetsp:Transcript_28633/g.92372  ORF Transcript_28633/g.92372 Transcript_28633/m.92372 type:complete len:330 (-) Transcript_28633:9-998(-)